MTWKPTNTNSELELFKWLELISHYRSSSENFDSDAESTPISRAFFILKLKFISN
jgi:hypothetical protein